MSLILRCFLVVVVAVAAGPAAVAQPVGSVQVRRYVGPSITVELSQSIKLNKDSSMRRDWFVIEDPASPLQIDGPVGVEVYYKAGERGVSGHYVYRTFTSVVPREAIVAYELKFHILDPFGRLLSNLGDMPILDVKAARIENSEWRIPSEAEASRAFASIGYVASVRTAAGKTYRIDKSAVRDAIRKIGAVVSDEELDSKR